MTALQLYLAGAAAKKLHAYTDLAAPAVQGLVIAGSFFAVAAVATYLTFIIADRVATLVEEKSST